MQRDSWVGAINDECGVNNINKTKKKAKFADHSSYATMVLPEIVHSLKRVAKGNTLEAPKVVLFVRTSKMIMTITLHSTLLYVCWDRPVDVFGCRCKEVKYFPAGCEGSVYAQKPRLHLISCTLELFVNSKSFYPMDVTVWCSNDYMVSSRLYAPV